jgi:hypothetical protein
MKCKSLSPLKLFCLSLFLVLAITGCQKENSSQPNDGLTTTLPTSVKVYLTDDQSLVFDKVFIDLQKLEIKIEDDGIDSVGGWFTLNIAPGVYDILQFRNGLDTLFATGTIPANRKLQKIRLTLGNNNSVEKDGKKYPLIVKDKDNEVIAKLESSNVEFTSPDQFMFWIDFDAGRSIRKNNSGSGNNNGFELRSQIRIFTKSKSGRIEGRVLPAAANATVMAINGNDTATAKPEREGEFRIVGLKAGTYKVFIDATSNNYMDSVVNNVLVRHNEDTKLGTIVLRQ